MRNIEWTFMSMIKYFTKNDNVKVSHEKKKKRRIVMICLILLIQEWYIINALL